MKSLNPFSDLEIESRVIFSHIHKNGPMTKRELAQATNLSLTTLNRMVMPLIEKDLIGRLRIGESTGGRKPSLYDINADRCFILGIDISRTYTKIAIVNLKLDLLSVRQFQMDQEATPEQTVASIGRIFDEELQRLGTDRTKFIGAGLGTVGPLNREQGTIISPHLFPAPGWSMTPIVAMLEDELALPVELEIGVNSAAMAEHYFGYGKGKDNIAYVNCGVGIKMGMVMSGTIARTLNNADDAFGHMIINVDGEKCSCGNYGCIEAYTSIPSIEAAFANELKQGRHTSIPKALPDIRYTDICLAAAQGDTLAAEVISKAAATLGTGLANFINLLNPNVIVLSGPLIKLSELYYEVSTSVARKKCNVLHEDEIMFEKGGYFDGNTIVVGAASMVIEKWIH